MATGMPVGARAYVLQMRAGDDELQASSADRNRVLRLRRVVARPSHHDRTRGIRSGVSDLHHSCEAREDIRRQRIIAHESTRRLIASAMCVSPCTFLRFEGEVHGSVGNYLPSWTDDRHFE